jgi:hypothetical protein
MQELGSAGVGRVGFGDEPVALSWLDFRVQSRGQSLVRSASEKECGIVTVLLGNTLSVRERLPCGGFATLDIDEAESSPIDPGTGFAVS